MSWKVLPLASAEKIRRDAFLPLPSLLRRVCPVFPFLQTLQFPTSLQDGQWYSLCFSVPSSLPQPRYFFSSDQSMSLILFCTHPLSTTNFLVIFRCLSVHDSLVHLRRLVPATLLLSIPRTRALLPIYSIRPSCFRSIFFASCGQTTLMSTATPLKHQGVPL